MRVYLTAAALCLLGGGSSAEPIPLLAERATPTQTTALTCSTPKPPGWHCGSRGTPNQPNVVKTTADMTFDACRDSCIRTLKCHVFGFSGTASGAGSQCTLYGASEKQMGITNSKSAPQIWNRHCFCCTPDAKVDGCYYTPTTSSPTSTSTTTTTPSTTTTPTTTDTPTTTAPTTTDTPTRTDTPTTTSTTPTSSTGPSLPSSCAPNSFLLQARNNANSPPELSYAVVVGDYVPITDFTSDPLSATVFFLDSRNRIAMYEDAGCTILQTAAHWNGDTNPYTTFWFEQDQYQNFYGDYPASCSVSDAVTPLACTINAGGTIENVFAYCTTSDQSQQFVELDTGVNSPDNTNNGVNCTPLNLYPVFI